MSDLRGAKPQGEPVATGGGAAPTPLPGGAVGDALVLMTEE